MDIGAPEILIVLLVVILLFGAKKLPELARGSGRAIRIFKSETKGLMDDEDDEQTDQTKQLNQSAPPVAAPPQPTDSGQAAPPAPPMHTEN